MTYTIAACIIAVVIIITWPIGNIAGWLACRIASKRKGRIPEPWNWRVLRGHKAYFDWWYEQKRDL